MKNIFVSYTFMLFVNYSLFAQNEQWYDGFILDLDSQKIEGKLFFNDFDHLLSFKNERLNVKYAPQEINGFSFFDTKNNAWINYHSLVCNKHINKYEQADFLELKFEGKKISVFHRKDLRVLNSLSTPRYVRQVYFYMIVKSGYPTAYEKPISYRSYRPGYLSPNQIDSPIIYRKHHQKGIYFLNKQGLVILANKKTIQTLVGNKKNVLKKFVRTKLLQYQSTIDVIKILAFCDTLLD